ncbi:sulfotransferase [Xanthomonas campestris]|uniref:tetratricopeptide repeat-containing sulfotransferase family protein n=1 Tax=Xanthomonas campestris TaxID=339 RepID=UPI002359628E|nr:sulfotransferase [Xanthomonas campestris]MDC8744907.1 sulfotransferase [Xanthomonas campestris]
MKTVLQSACQAFLHRLAGRRGTPALKDIRGWEGFAVQLRASEHLEDACAAYLHLATLVPEEPAYWINAGNALLELQPQVGSESAELAMHAFDEAAKHGAFGDVALELGRGLALLTLQDYQSAKYCLRRAWLREPLANDVALAYAQCLMELEQFDEVGDCIAVLQTSGMTLSQQETYAWMLAHCGQEQRALVLYERLLTIRPGATDLRIQLALLLERLNLLEEAGVHLGHSSITAVEPSAMLGLAMGRLLRRRGQMADAQYWLGLGSIAAGNGDLAALIEFERAKVADSCGQVEEAMTALASAHARSVAAYSKRFPLQSPGTTLQWLDESLSEPAPSSWSERGCIVQPLPDPVFLVGFPRSGTTLLERVLDAHPQLAVLDERPALEHAIEVLRSNELPVAGSFDAWLDKKSPEQLDLARKAYWRTAEKHVSIKHGLVDKYPLNLTRVPYISRLFPQSCYLLLLRDPCDCVLSCYMQAFGMRGGALAFASLEATAQTYDKVMSCWEEQRDLVGAELHTLRYEDLVGDFELHVASVLRSLGVQWDPAVAAFRQQILEGGRRINTPSYAQVVEPVSGRAIGRWIRYREHFSERALALLEPWRRRYGYDAV